MKTIFINGRFLGGRLSGVPRYGRELVNHVDALLVEYKSGVRVELLLPKSIQPPESYQKIKVRQVGFLSGHAWEQFELPFYASGGILFTPTGSAPLLHSHNILTIHDAIVFAAPAGFSRVYTMWYRFLSKVLCRTALRVLTVSQFSKGELIRWCGAKAERVIVIYPGAQHLTAVMADDSIQRRYSLRRFGYVLAVGSSSPNKNFRGVIEACDFLNESGIEIVLVGQTGLQVGHHGAQSEGLNTTRVRDLGYVTDNELRSLYENAGCFVFPSLYEGFGIPPIEALSLGCPTVISDIAPLKEVCGSVAIVCDPQDPKDIADKIKQAMNLRADPTNATRFMTFVSRYSYSHAAGQLLDLLFAAAKER